MLRSVPSKSYGSEGYIYPVYGDIKYLKFAIASAATLRRHDPDRPIAIVCEKKHRNQIEKSGIGLFDLIIPIDQQHCSIVGFKHNFYQYMLFDRNLFLDCDMVWCRNPDSLWKSLTAYPITITGYITADSFFGGPKNLTVIRDLLLGRRKRTLNRFGLSYLSRVQSGMIFAQDTEKAKKVCQLSSQMLERKSETHFQSRTMEQGRSEESCEWSLAMAMSKLNIPVYPWMQGQESPQLDYIQDLTDHDPDFEFVNCRYFCNAFVYSLRGLKSVFIRNILTQLFSLIPGFGDSMEVTPFVLHFGWLHQKQPFFEFSERNWNRIKTDAGDSFAEIPIMKPGRST